MPWETKRLPARPDVVAPDGSDVRILLGLAGGGMAHFELSAGGTSVAVVHRTVEEIWFFIGGRGEMWRGGGGGGGGGWGGDGGGGEVVEVGPGVSLTIPVGTRFQFRALGSEPLAAIAVTMPPWPGPDEAVSVDGRWEPTVSAP